MLAEPETIDLKPRRTVYLRGELGERFGEVWEFDARSTSSLGDVLRALEANRPEIYSLFLTAHLRGVGFGVRVGSRVLDEDSLAFPLGTGDVEILPVPLASSGQGWWQILLGVIIIAVAWWNPLGWYGGGVLWGGVLAGAAMVIGGIVSLALSPPDFESPDAEEQGYIASSQSNRSRTGDPVPVVFGKTLCGSAPISFDAYSNGWGVKDQEVEVVDVVSEGEIEGFADEPGKSIFFDETKAEELGDIYYSDGVPDPATGELYEWLSQWQEAYDWWQDMQRSAAKLEAHIRYGSNDQSTLPGSFAKSRTLVSVRSNLDQGQVVPRTTTAGKVLRGVRLNFSINQLVHTPESGGDAGQPQATQLLVRVEIFDSNGDNRQLSYFNVHDRVLARRSYTMFFELEGVAPWTIKVEKITQDTTKKTQNNVSWDSYVEIGDRVYSYPNTAVIGIRHKASAFQGKIPTRAYLLKGVKCRVPSNYNTTTRVYTGNWDGDFKNDREWTDNPVWCWLEYLTNFRFGLGQYVSDSNVDMWSLYRAAQYCDELVDDGKGGTEPRYSFNAQLRRPKQSWRVLMDMASNFGAMPIWTGSKVALMQDRPEDPIFQFNPTNVVDGLFTYASTPLRERTTRAVVQYQNPDDLYSPATVIVEDKDGIARYGIRTKKVTALGVTSKSQATRFARRIIRSESFSEAITFTTGLEGAALQPGRVISVLDPHRNAQKNYGRIVHASDDYIRTDRDVEIEAGATYTLDIAMPHQQEIISANQNATTLVLAHSLPNEDYRAVRVWEDWDDDGSYSVTREPTAWDEPTKTLTLVGVSGSTDPRNYRVEYAPGLHQTGISNSPGITRKLNLSTNFPTDTAVPYEATLWVLTKQNEDPVDYRVISVKHSNPTVFTIEAIEYDADKESYIESGYVTSESPGDDIPPPYMGEVVPRPVGLDLIVAMRRDVDGIIKPSLVATWGEPEDASAYGIIGYRVRYETPTQGRVFIPDLIVDNTYVLPNIEPGYYTVFVSSERVDGRVSSAVSSYVSYTEDSLPDLTTKVTALTLEDTPQLTTFASNDIAIAWRASSSYVDGLNESDGADNESVDPLLKDFRITIYDADSGAELRQLHVSKEITRYVYTYAANKADGPDLGPSRRVRFNVAPRSIHNTVVEENGQALTVYNAPPPVPNVSVSNGLNLIWVSLTGSEGDPDFAGYLVWGRQTTGPGDTLDDAELIDANLLATQTASLIGAPAEIPIDAEGGQEYVLRVAGYDGFSRNASDLNVSVDLKTTPNAESAGGPSKSIDETGTNGYTTKTTIYTAPSPSDDRLTTWTDSNGVEHHQVNEPGASWTTDQWAGAYFERSVSPFEQRLIVGNDADTLDLQGKLTVGPSASATETGNASGGDQNTLEDTDSGKSFPDYSGYWLGLRLGEADEEWHVITSNTSNTIDIGTDFNVIPVLGDLYGVYTDKALVSGWKIISYPKFKDTSKSWTTNEWAGSELEILSGPGIGQARSIASNDSNELTLDEPFEGLGLEPDTVCAYQIVSTNFIDNAVSELKILRGTIHDALISSLRADKITAGTLQVLLNLGVGGNIVLDGENDVIRIYDNQGYPIERVTVGKTDTGAQDWGIQVRDDTGKMIVDIDGLGIDVVNTAAIIDHAVSVGSLTASMGPYSGGFWTHVGTAYWDSKGEAPHVSMHVTVHSGYGSEPYTTAARFTIYHDGTEYGPFGYCTATAVWYGTWKTGYYQDQISYGAFVGGAELSGVAAQGEVRLWVGSTGGGGNALFEGIAAIEILK